MCLLERGCDDVMSLQVVQVVAGGMHSVCLCESGKIYSWGVNDEGALGRYTDGDAWKNSGLATGTPGDAYTPAEVTMPDGCAHVIMLSAGDSHTAALTVKGEVYAWGTFRDSSGVMGFADGSKIQVCSAHMVQASAIVHLFI